MYLYRDGANYKQYGEAVYSNITGLSLAYINTFLKARLIDGEWFYVKEWGLKDLHHYPYDPDIDHDYHEFGDVEETVEVVTNGDIMDLLVLLQKGG